MLKEIVIFDDYGGGAYSIYETSDVEFVDPLKYHEEILTGLFASFLEQDLLAAYPSQEVSKFMEQIHERANKDAKNELRLILETPIPEKLLCLLTATNKKTQVRLLKNLRITANQLNAWVFKAHLNFGYAFSQYKSEHHQNGLDKSKLPTAVELRQGKVLKVGHTTLTDGELKQAVDARKVTIAKFIDTKDSWHCFFLTFDSLKGKETWKDGQPHYHYISDKFGIPRSTVVKELRKKYYKLGSLPHIDIIDELGEIE